MNWLKAQHSFVALKRGLGMALGVGLKNSGDSTYGRENYGFG